MDQTTEQTAQPEVTQTTTSLTTEQPQETSTTLTTPQAPTVDFKTLIPEEYREESHYKILIRWMTLLNHIYTHRRW